VGDLIFAALCMMIAAFFILVLGVFGALLYLTSRAGALIGRLALGHRTTAWISRNRPLGTRFEPHARTIAVFVRRASSASCPDS
jgi:hypothetical protein